MIRKIKQQDFNDISKIIQNTWNYQEYNRSRKNSEISAKLDLLSTLIHSNYSSVYEIGGEIAGFLLANIKENPVKENFSYLKDEIQFLKDLLRESKEGLIFLDYGQLYEKMNNGLLGKLSYRGKNEITLFAINSEFRGQGIGKALIENFLSYLKQIGERDCFLFTDSTCDYPFYFQYDFKNRTHDQAKAELRHGETIDFFLFEKNNI